MFRDGNQQDQSGSSASSSNEQTQQYGLEAGGILTGSNNTNWNQIKNEVEILYTIIPTMTLDLYDMNINQEDIKNFNKEMDDLTIAVKNEDKENTLIKLANLYRYLPAYASNFSRDSNYISILETKSNIYKAYAFANLNNWDEASNYTKKSIESHLRALNNLQNTRNYDTNKIYVILNEIQSAVNIKDKDIFFIKYKNFVEEADRY